MINPNKFANQKMQEFGQTAFDIQQFEENNMQMRQGVNKIQSLDSPVPPPGSVPESPYGDITVNPIMQQDLKKQQPQPQPPKQKVFREREKIVSSKPPQKEQQRENIPLNVNLDPNKIYVVNKEKTGTPKDTLSLDKNVFVSKSGFVDDEAIRKATKEAVAKGIYNLPKNNDMYNFNHLEDSGKAKYKN